MIAIDTNLLVYAHRAGVKEHRAARSVLVRASRDGRGWGFADHCLAEFWSVVTHPSAEGRPSTPAEARGFLDRLVETGGAKIWSPRERFGERLLSLAASLGVVGVRVFDLKIALTAFDNGATEIWTLDGRFARLPGLRVVNPF